jgi:hypothetical protein
LRVAVRADEPADGALSCQQPFVRVRSSVVCFIVPLNASGDAIISLAASFASLGVSPQGLVSLSALVPVASARLNFTVTAGSVSELVTLGSDFDGVAAALPIVGEGAGRRGWWGWSAAGAARGRLRVLRRGQE